MSLALGESEEIRMFCFPAGLLPPRLRKSEFVGKSQRKTTGIKKDLWEERYQEHPQKYRDGYCFTHPQEHS